jgi:NADPH:quinone reductase-like Zn-dependent oxidoreductase
MMDAFDDLPKTHKAVVTPARRAPLVLLDVPTVPPLAGDVVVRVEWTSSTPLNLHQADGGLLVKHPQILSADYAGVVVAVGAEPGLKGLKVGDKVFGYAFRTGSEKTHQEYITVPSFLAGKIPEGMSMQEVVTVPLNLVTAFNVLTKDLELQLPWPVPRNWNCPLPDTPILIWGAASSVGIYCIQVLRHWGYKNVLAVASGKHHEHLSELGAAGCFDYRDSAVVSKILDSIATRHGNDPRIPESRAIVAVMLPIILRDATEDEEPEYEMDVSNVLKDRWADGVILRGCRTHHYLEVNQHLPYC